MKVTRSYCESLRHSVDSDPVIARMSMDDQAAVKFHLETFDERFRREDWDGCLLAYRHIEEVKRAVECRPSPNQEELFA